MGNKQKTVETLTIEELRKLAAKFGKIKEEYENLVSQDENTPLIVRIPRKRTQRLSSFGKISGW